MAMSLREDEILRERFKVGETLLPPLVITAIDLQPPAPPGVDGRRQHSALDARIEAEWPGQPGRYCFAVEAKVMSSPRAIRSAAEQARAFASTCAGTLPMILVPYLSKDKLLSLAAERMNAVDLCGNGTVTIPGKLSVFHSGEPNQHPDNRPLVNPYRGLSAMVGRTFLKQGRWGSLTELAGAIRSAGAEISLSQCSKAVRALAEDLIVSTVSENLQLKEPLQLLERLGAGWRARPPAIRRRVHLRMPPQLDWSGALSSARGLQWAMTGESSVMLYAVFGQGGPPRLAVSDLDVALARLPGSQSETVPNFADLQLVQAEEPGYFFDNHVDSKGIRWASRLQTWLELQAGDARQQSAAQELRNEILHRIIL